MTVSKTNPGGYVIHTYDIKADAVEVLCDHDEDASTVILYCLGLNVILRLNMEEALRVASDIQDATREQ